MEEGYNWRSRYIVRDLISRVEIGRADSLEEAQAIADNYNMWLEDDLAADICNTVDPRPEWMGA